MAAIKSSGGKLYIGSEEVACDIYDIVISASHSGLMDADLTIGFSEDVVDKFYSSLARPFDVGISESGNLGLEDRIITNLDVTSRLVIYVSIRGLFVDHGAMWRKMWDDLVGDMG